ncbi:MAG: hypothetical protein H7Z40_02995, partial [Phycisphaerae bacterium]|nr:hypothetical protein [Gemmatimonadaceae bacterium]
DPAGVLNAGCKVAPADNGLQGDIRYDPSLQPLNASARNILDRIERSRDWSRFRLCEIPDFVSDYGKTH